MQTADTKKAEYRRSIEVMEDIKQNKDLTMLLYFIADSGYNNEDILAMAKLLQGFHEGKEHGIRIKRNKNFAKGK